MIQNRIIRRAIALSCIALANSFGATATAQQAATETKRHDGRPADMSKPVKVFILLGQSNMVGLGKISPGGRGKPEDTLEFAVKNKMKYAYLVDDAGNWSVRKDVRFVRMMQGNGLMNNEWLGVAQPEQIFKSTTIGPEFGIGHVIGNAVDAPVMILKSCIGNRALGWHLLPPGSERFEEGDMVYAGYREAPASWPKGTEPTPPVIKPGERIVTLKGDNPAGWYAGKQYDDDTADAKIVLAELDKHFPGAKSYEVAGFFYWQGEKDAGNPVWAARYEKNLVQLIKALRKDFNAPNAKFVLGTMGESVKGSGGNGGKILEAHLAVDGTSGKYPEFKGNVATIYTHPMAQGGSGNGHYGGKAEVYMDVGEAMGRAMVELLNNQEPAVDKRGDGAIAPVEDVAFFERKYQRKITGVKPKNEYDDPDAFYSAIAVQLGVPEVAWEAAAAKFGWKKDDGKVTKSIVKGGPTADGGQGKWDVMIFRAALNPDTEKPDPAAIEIKIVQIDYDGGIKFFDGK